jgi:hypothetical protein
MYIAPEQARSPDVDGRADIYALGVVAYELILGQHPFPDAKTPTAMLAAHLTEVPPQPRAIWPEVPAALDVLLFSMLAKDPSHRPSLAQMRTVVAGVRSGAGDDARATTTLVAHRPRNTRVLWVGILVMIALIVGIAIGARGRGSSSDLDPRPRAAARNEPAPTTALPSATAVSAAVVDAGDVFVTDAPITTKLTPLKPRTSLHTPDPTIAKEVNAQPPPSNAPPIDAPPQVPAPEPPPSPPLENPEVAKPQVIPAKTPGTEKAPQRPVPPTRPPGRNDTINPFKKGSSR